MMNGHKGTKDLILSNLKVVGSIALVLDISEVCRPAGIYINILVLFNSCNQIWGVSGQGEVL